MENCIFCKIIKGEISTEKIWEDENHLAFLDVKPINTGHTLLIPKKHTEYIFDLNDKEYSELMLNVKKIAAILKNKLKPKKIGLLVEGFGVPHTHIHIIPINNGGGISIEKAKDADLQELKKIAKKIKE